MTPWQTKFWNETPCNSTIATAKKQSSQQPQIRSGLECPQARRWRAHSKLIRRSCCCARRSLQENSTLVQSSTLRTAHGPGNCLLKCIFAHSRSNFSRQQHEGVRIPLTPTDNSDMKIMSPTWVVRKDLSLHWEDMTFVNSASTMGFNNCVVWFSAVLILRYEQAFFFYCNSM